MLNDNKMFTFCEAYGVFEKLMNEEKVFLLPELTFEDVCGWLGVPTSELDSLIKEELGLGGEELMTSYRNDWAKNISKKYNIQV